jgi:formylglycine-generating enzyme required for sulfatase activity
MLRGKPNGTPGNATDVDLSLAIASSGSRALGWSRDDEVCLGDMEHDDDVSGIIFPAPTDSGTSLEQARGGAPETEFELNVEAKSTPNPSKLRPSANSKHEFELTFELPNLIGPRASIFKQAIVPGALILMLVGGSLATYWWMSRESGDKDPSAPKPKPKIAGNDTRRMAPPDATGEERPLAKKSDKAITSEWLVATRSSPANLPWAPNTSALDGFHPPPELSLTSEPTLKSDKLPPANEETITNSIGMKMRLISPNLMLDSHGTFMMGSGAHPAEEPRHPVTIRDTFRIAVHKTTQAQFNEIMKRNPSWFSASGGAKDRVKGDTSKHPVDTVTYFDAVEFCNKLSEREGMRPCYRLNSDVLTRTGDGGIALATVEPLPDGTGYRLPSEAEWEYCARAGTATQYGFDEKQIEEYVWYERNSDQVTHAVDTKKPNRWGLYHMNGLLWEWCDDVWHDNYAEAPPHSIAWRTSGEQGKHIARGGAWCCDVDSCRSANRNSFVADYQSKYVGFRVVRVSP